MATPPTTAIAMPMENDLRDSSAAAWKSLRCATVNSLARTLDSGGKMNTTSS